MAPLAHIASRLHGIGGQSRQQLLPGYKFHPFFVVCAHAGLKTGEDGPTHADPQPLQLLQENFPKGMMITLTPWEPAEIWPLVAASLRSAPGRHRALCYPAGRDRPRPRGAEVRPGDGRRERASMPCAAPTRSGSATARSSCRRAA